MRSLSSDIVLLCRPQNGLEANDPPSVRGEARLLPLPADTGKLLGHLEPLIVLPALRTLKDAQQRGVGEVVHLFGGEQLRHSVHDLTARGLERLGRRRRHRAHYVLVRQDRVKVRPHTLHDLLRVVWQRRSIGVILQQIGLSKKARSRRRLRC